MSDLRIRNFGGTANGAVSGFMPVANIRTPEWKNVDIVGDLINKYYQREQNKRENELLRLKGEESDRMNGLLELKRNEQALDEQKFAYGAYNDEVGRQLALKLKEIENKNAIDKEMSKYKYIQGIEDANKRKRDMMLRSIIDIQQRNKNGSGVVVDLYHPEVQALTKKFSPVDVMNAFNTISGFNKPGYGNNIVNGGNGGVGDSNANVYSPYNVTNWKDI
ncbi:hypothetical protein ACWZUH_000061 [Campylobacter fetus]|uniref:Uncharacterized protein n=1 Tax=Campylobacter fetus TaxID=196 RepID=A0A825BDD1_CAMFE|nr:hypothetical protein [Campylobacter fetus]